MKYIFTLLALCCALSSHAQKYQYKGIQNFPVNQETGKVSYEAVVEVPGISSEVLFNRSREWFVRTFKGGTDVLKLDDRIASKLIAEVALNGTSKGLACGGNYDFPFEVSVEVKDGRYKYTLTNIEYKRWVDSQKRYIDGPLQKLADVKECEKAHEPMFAKLNQDIEALIQSLESSMKDTNKKEDW